MKYLILSACLLASCAPEPGTLPRHVPLEIPPKARPVETAAVRSSTAAAMREGTLASARVEKIAAEVRTLETHLDAAVTEADRLRKQKSADERELEQMWQSLTKIQQRHDALHTEAEGAKQALDRQKAAHARTGRELAVLEKAARDLGIEAALLRSNLSTAEKLRASTGQALESANASAAAHLKKAQSLGGELRVFRIAAGILVLAALAWLLAPLLKRTLLP